MTDLSNLRTDVEALQTIKKLLMTETNKEKRTRKVTCVNTKEQHQCRATGKNML